MSVSQSEFTNKYSIIRSITDDDFYDKNVYLLGSAERGKINEPVLIKNMVQFINSFGASGSLYETYKHLSFLEPSCDIYICKVTGAYGYMKLNLPNSTEAILLRTKEAYEGYNNITLTIDRSSITFAMPEVLKSISITYSLDDYNYLGNLIQKINSDTENGLNYVYIESDLSFHTELKNNLYDSNEHILSFTGASSGLLSTKNELYECLKTSYEALEGFDIHIINAADAYMDDIIPEGYNPLFYSRSDYLNLLDNNEKASFYNLLLNFCTRQFKLGFKTHGIIGFNSLNETAAGNLDTYISEIQKCLLEQIKNPYYSFLVSAAAGDLVYDNKTSNSQIAYIAASADTISKISLTNIANEKVEIATEFNKEQLKALKDIGVCAFRYSYYRNAPVVYSGITAKLNHDLHYYCNMRMILTAMHLIRRQTENVTGEVFDINVLKGLYIELLNYMKDMKLISEYELNITLEGLDTANINISLKTVYMSGFVKTSSIIYLGE